MRKFILLQLFAFCILANKSFSQNLFREGFIEKKSGIVLNGMIEFKANQKIPDQCKFKRFDIATTVIYSPDEIKAFGYKNGNRYESLKVGGKSSFYEVLVYGKIILYMKGSEYYVEKDRKGPVKVENGPVEYMENGSKKKFESLQTFLYYLTEGKAGAISSKFNIKEELLPLIISYNKFSGEDYYTYNHSFSERQFAKEMMQSGTKMNRFGILSGVNMYNLNIRIYGAYTGFDSDFAPDSDFETGPVLGISYEHNIFRKSEKLSVRLDLYYVSQDFYCYSESKTSTTNINEAFFKFTAVKAPLLLQYSIPGRRLVPFFNAGGAYQHILSSDYFHIEEIEKFGNEISTYEDNDLKFNNGEISAVAGIGARFRLINNISLNFQTRFEYGKGLFENEFPEDLLNRASYSKPYKQNSLQVDILFGITF